MTLPIRLTLAGTLAVGLALSGPAAAQDAVALSPTSQRVLSDITDTVKDDDGGRVTLRTVLAYDPTAGEYVQTVTESDGSLRARTVLPTPMIRPSAAEDAAAKALVALDPEVAARIAGAQHPVEISGGFPLVREAGHGCGPGSRCLQYDVYEIVPGETFARRIRYVVVDLRALRLFSNDFDPVADGNLATPAARAQSRAN